MDEMCSKAYMAEKVLRSPPRLLEDGEIEEEAEDMLVDICGDASPVPTKTLAEPANHPGGSSGSSSDSGTDDASVTSSPAPAVLHNTGASPVTTCCAVRRGGGPMKSWKR